MLGREQSTGEERVVTTACRCHCGGTCIIKAYVRDGAITRLETDDGKEPQLRACLKGRANRQRVYAPDRLKFPMKRVGARGEGKFERITWDEALDTVAGELIRVRETYGPAAILFRFSGGDCTSLNVAWLTERVLLMAGGCTRTWGGHSNEGGNFASLACYGSMATRSTHDDFLNSRLIILWGWNPSTTVAGTNTAWYLAQAKEKGIKIISVDLRYTETTTNFTHQWIPIIPGTDAAMLIAMAYVIIKDNLQDQAFLDKYTVGFEQFKDYVLGKEDNVPKTPAWAESITGVPAATIENLAVEYATTKPAALMCGIAPGRTAHGEQYHRAAITLAAMTGNIGIRGGSSAGNVFAEMFGGYPFAKLPYVGWNIGGVDNPVEYGAPPRKYAISRYGAYASNARINLHKTTDAILKGKAGGYPADIKLLYMVNCNYPNQLCNINKSVQALHKLEFIVVHEQFMTPAAKFADIVLPTSSLYEREDVSEGFGVPPAACYFPKVIEPLHESKSHLEIANELAARMGIPNYDRKTDGEWLREIINASGIAAHIDYDTFKKQGFYKFDLAEPHIAFKNEIEDPANHPFPTPSGKIEIYSQLLADMEHPQLPPIPKYIETWESRNDPLAKKYPLQLITTHIKRRAHSQFETIPWLRELQPQAVLINAVDAKARGINDGDQVRVFNDRGQMVITARVTERIMPGVVDIPQGAWYDPDEKGVDKGGSANVLTKDEPSLSGAFPSNTSLVQVEKVGR